MSYETRIREMARKQFIGRRITDVCFMDQESADEMGWSYRGIVITLDDGTQLYPSRDEEGNDAGVIFTSLEGELSVIGRAV